MTTTRRAQFKPGKPDVTGHDQKWYDALDPELVPERGLLLDQHNAWYNLGDLWVWSSHITQDRLRFDVEMLILGCATLLRTHRRDPSGGCVRCHDDTGRTITWPCPVWTHLGQWLKGGLGRPRPTFGTSKPGLATRFSHHIRDIPDHRGNLPGTPNAC